MRILSVLLAGTLAVTAAHGAPPAEQNAAVEAKAQAARTAYKAGDFAQAVELYLEAYRMAPAAAVLYNVAIIYDRKLAEPELAMTFYRRYIGSPDADPAAVIRATKRLQALKTEQTARQAQAATLPDPGEGTPNPQITAPAQPAPSSSQAAIGWAVAGVGGAALIAGAVVGVMARNTQADFADSRTLNEKMSLRDDGERQALTADIFMGAGAALALTGVVVALTAPKGGATAAVVPTADGHGAMAWLGGVTW